MANILLFGGTDSFGIPDVVQSWVSQYNNMDEVKFILGDKNGIDSSFHKLLGAVGALGKSQLYYLDTIKNNKWDLTEHPFKATYNSESKTVSILDETTNSVVKEITDVNKIEDVPHNREYYSFIDRKLIDDCDMAICVWDGNNRRVTHMIQIMNILGKQCYSFVV